MRELIKITQGYVYGRLTVIREGERHGKRNSRTAVCKCKCGNIKSVTLGQLRSGRTRSCGCLFLESLNETNTITKIKHNKSGTKIYGLWGAMHQRTRNRKAKGENTDVCDEWHDFEKFEQWVLSSGYAHGLVLCRNGDVGDYCPTNVRWDTLSNNTKEAMGRGFALLDPSGVLHEGFNLSEFCRGLDVCRGHMSAVNRGELHQHKGWTKPTDNK